MTELGRANEYELVGSIDTVKRLLVRYREAGVSGMNLRCFGADETSYFYDDSHLCRGDYARLSVTPIDAGQSAAGQQTTEP